MADLTFTEKHKLEKLFGMGMECSPFRLLTVGT
jgi:hypothetical protein